MSRRRCIKDLVLPVGDLPPRDSGVMTRPSPGVGFLSHVEHKLKTSLWSRRRRVCGLCFRKLDHLPECERMTYIEYEFNR